MTDIESKLNDFEYEKIAENQYSIRSVKIDLLEHAELPEGVVEIHSSAFGACTFLESVSLPSTLKVIRASAFQGCSSLQKIVIPDSVQSIEENAFQDCESLKEVFIPDSVKRIGDYAFANCTALSNVRLPSGLLKISTGLFDSAHALKEISIPDTVQIIDHFAFRRTSLKKLLLPASVDSIATTCLMDTPIKSLQFAGTRAEWKKVAQNITTVYSLRVYCLGDGEKTLSRSSSRAQKKTIEKEKEKNELLWEIKICEAAIEKTTNRIKGNSFLALNTFFRMLLHSCAWYIPALIVWLGLGQIETAKDLFAPILIWIAVFLGFFSTIICWSIFDRKEQHINRDIREVLSERLRIARLRLSACEAGTLPSEAETKYYLSFTDAQKRCCANCAYLGKVIKKTTTEYSDGTTTESQSVDHYFCQKLNDAEVEKGNVCNEYASERVANAFVEAQKRFRETEEKWKDQAARSAIGYR